MFHSKYNYPIFMMMAIAILASLVQLVVIGLLGLTTASLVMIGVILVVHLVISVWQVGTEWPETEGESHSKFWAGLLNLYYIGYERAGLSKVPYATLALGGFTIGFITFLIEAQKAIIIGGHVFTTPEVLAGAMVLMIVYPLVGVMSYGIGYIFGGKREARLDHIKRKKEARKSF